MRKWRRMENDYLQRNGKERFGRCGVGDLIYRNKREETKIKKYSPNLVDDLPGTLTCSTLLWRRLTHRS